MKKVAALGPKPMIGASTMNKRIAAILAALAFGFTALQVMPAEADDPQSPYAGVTCETIDQPKCAAVLTNLAVGGVECRPSDGPMCETVDGRAVMHVLEPVQDCDDEEFRLLAKSDRRADRIRTRLHDRIDRLRDRIDRLRGRA